MPASPTVARLSATHAALRRWAVEPDPGAATLPARAAFLRKFEAEVDPDGRLDPDERRRRALIQRRAYMAKLSLNRAIAREAKKRRHHDPQSRGGAKRPEPDDAQPVAS